MSPEWEIAAWAAAGLVALGVAFVVGRRTSGGMVRARELEAELEDLRKDHEIALAEVEAAKHEWKRTQKELEQYRGSVLDHFSGTSSMLRDLTLQYRAVYDHLTAGARTLCPEAVLEVGGGVADALPPSAESKPEPARGGGADGKPGPSPAAAPRPRDTAEA